MASGTGRPTVTAWVYALLAALIGLIVGLLLNDPVPGVVFGLGLLVGSLGSILIVPALRGTPAGLSGAAVDDAAAGWAEFHRELARARRFDGQFAIIRFSAEDLPDLGAVVGRRNDIAASARRIDRVWIHENHILLLLPQATQAAADVVLGRIRARVPTALAVEPGLATFPEHGITSGSLIAAVYGSGREEVPTPIAAVRPDFRPQAASGVAGDDEAADPGPSDDRASWSG